MFVPSLYQLLAVEPGSVKHPILLRSIQIVVTMVEPAWYLDMVNKYATPVASTPLSI